MGLEPVENLDDPRVADYRDVPDPELLRERGVFVAEGRLVVRTLLQTNRFRVKSVLASAAAIAGLSDVLDPAAVEFPVYVASHDQLASIVGFNVHRGCLAIGVRQPAASAQELIGRSASTRLVVVAEHVGNADNMGGIFRNAMAFGASAVLLSPDGCDPLYRKAIRVSIGGTLRVPFAVVQDWPDGLAQVKQAGFSLIGLTPDRRARELGDWAFSSGRPGRVALLLGHEGVGLTEPALAMTDERVRIEMAAGVDSLNVATAAGIAMYACSGLWRS